MNPETKIVQDIIHWVRKAGGGDAWHVHGSGVQRAGEPDIDGAIKHYPTDFNIPVYIHFKVEVKTTTGKVSKIQLYRLETWDKLGYVTGIVRSIEEFVELMREHGYKDASMGTPGEDGRVVSEAQESPAPGGVWDRKKSSFLRIVPPPSHRDRG